MALPEPIEPGDVVLSRGTGWVSRAICLVDDSEVSHAALALDAGSVAEVVGKGLRTVTFEQAMDGHDLAVGRTLTTPADMSPVLAVARGYLARPVSYAHQQIVLLAVLCTTRRVPLPPGGRRMVRTVLDQAACAVNTMAERGRQPMVCSEFVARCHGEARPCEPYVLKTGDDEAAADGRTLLECAHSHPDLPRLPVPEATGAFDPAAAEKALAPLVSAYATAVGRTDFLPLGHALPASAPPAEPGEEELLGAMTAFGNALHRAARPQEHRGPVPPGEALERIRAMAAAPDFVTPGDLVRTASLTEHFRLAVPVPGRAAGTPGTPLGSLLRRR
ncbi:MULTISPECIES: hypothetical protein [Streptomyces]|uniref:Uncharacterized protein n=1 Tax=Streptomyces luteosporeus TaxID=173856 RepID=A0ABP6G750_9ACTN